jgi:hypothetical protein
MGHRRAGDGLERVVTRYPGATSRDEEIARRASLCWFPGPSVVRVGAADDLPNRRRARVALCAVASSGLRPSRDSSNRLRLQPTVPVRVLPAVPCGRRARSNLHVIRNRRGGVATNRHATMNASYAVVTALVKRQAVPVVPRGSCLRLQNITDSSAPNTRAEPRHHIQRGACGGIPGRELDRVRIR